MDSSESQEYFEIKNNVQVWTVFFGILKTTPLTQNRSIRVQKSQ